MSTAERLTLGTVWCLARVTGEIATNWQFAKKVNPPKNPSLPACLKVNVEGFGTLTPGKPRHSGGRRGIMEGASRRRETCKVRGVILFIAGFVTDQCLVRNRGNRSPRTKVVS